MAKFYRPKLNSWLMTLGLVSIGLHGLVLALPMPSLVEPTPPEIEELPDPEVIQVVTLPKLATAPDSIEPPIPEPLEEQEPEPELELEVPLESPILMEPEILEEVASEPESEQGALNALDQPTNLDEGGAPRQNDNETEQDKKLKNPNNYSFDGEKTGEDHREGGTGFGEELLGWMAKRSLSNPKIFETDYLEAIEATLDPIESLNCLPDAPSLFISVAVAVSATDGSLVKNPESPYALNSTGYKVLDEKALEIAREADYSYYFDTAAPAPGYWFNIQVKYDDSSC